MQQKPKIVFSFVKINEDKILRKFLKLETSKPCQDTDFQIKTMKENVDIYFEVLSSFPSSLNAPCPSAPVIWTLVASPVDKFAEIAFLSLSQIMPPRPINK